jgi:hypothetical protein
MTCVPSLHFHLAFPLYLCSRHTPTFRCWVKTPPFPSLPLHLLGSLITRVSQVQSSSGCSLADGTLEVFFAPHPLAPQCGFCWAPVILFRSCLPLWSSPHFISVMAHTHFLCHSDLSSVNLGTQLCLWLCTQHRAQGLAHSRHSASI